MATLSDNIPASDLLGFDRYVAPLTGILRDPDTQTPFTVGIFGAWGTGKSTLLHLIQRELDRGDGFVCVWFNPWIYRGEGNMLVPLLQTLRDQLAGTTGFAESAMKIGEVLFRLGAGLLIKSFTAGATSLDELERIEEKVVRERQQATSEMANLRQKLSEVTGDITGKDKQLVLFIDDLDRCEPNEIIDVLESVKLFLDLQGVFVFLAIDKEIIDRGIAVRYSEFEFGHEPAVVGSEYLEKMVQLPLRLSPLAVGQVRTFIERIGPPADIAGQLDLLASLIRPNPRRVKRILNILAVNVAITKQIGLDPDLLARMAVLQVQHDEVYAFAARYPKLLEVLEACYAAELRPIADDITEKDYGPEAPELLAAAKQHYKPGTRLAKVFDGSSFRRAQPSIESYLTLLGA